MQGMTSLTGTVTRCRDTLLTAMLMVYNTLNATRAKLSAAVSLAGTKVPFLSNMRPPKVPQRAWRAVRVYGKGKWMRTPLLYKVSPRLKPK